MLRPGRVLETTAIGVALLLVAIVMGGVVADSSLADAFTLAVGDEVDITIDGIGTLTNTVAQ